MSKAEKYISDCTRNCSNELIALESRAGKEVISYNEWLTPDQARKAVEIAREEVLLNNMKEFDMTYCGKEGKFKVKGCHRLPSVEDMKEQGENLSHFIGEIKKMVIDNIKW